MATYDIRVDYLSFKLSDTFDSLALVNYANKEIINQDTGEVLGINLEPSQFSINPVGKDILVASFYRGGQHQAMYIADKFNLEVTRLDLCLDLPLPEGSDVKQQWQTLTDEVSAYIGERYNNPQVHYWQGQQDRLKGNLGYGASFWSRSGDKQLRIYSKQNEGKGFTRVEWQLRRDYAKQAFGLIRGKYPANKQRQLELFKAFCDEFLWNGAFGIDLTSDIEISRPIAKERAGATKEWVLLQVAPAIARHFISTGEDLSSMLVQEVEKIILAHHSRENEKLATYAERQINKAKNANDKKKRSPRAKKGDIRNGQQDD